MNKGNSKNGGCRKTALKICLVYAIVAAIWILLSDFAMGQLVLDAATQQTLGILKGWMFVAVTAICLYWVLCRQLCCREREVAARRQAEEQLRKLSRAVEQNPASIIITDREGNIDYVNPRFSEVTGYSLDEVRGKNPRLLKSGETSSSEYRRLWETISSGREWRGEFHNRRKNGELFWELASISPIVDEAGKTTHYLAIKEDITARKQADFERRALENQLRQSQKMEAIGQLAGGVAHDFNNILAATLMHLGLLRERPDLDRETLDAVGELESHAHRAASLTRQLLLFSRRSVMQVKPLDLNESVENLLKMLRRLIGEHITLKWQGRSVLPPILADAGMMEQIVMNLVVNARDAMPRGGTITIATRVVDIDVAQACAKLQARPGRFVCLSVSDTGCGMDETVLGRLFEPFFTTKEVGKGTGLGLATVYGIVNQHQGWISVESTVGQGSEFKIFLPVLNGAQTDASPNPPAQSLVGGREGILVVEDDPAVRSMLGKLLRLWGYRVFEAGDGNAALKFWELQSGNIDLLFTDQVMPEGMTGLELAHALRRSRPELSVIISSGYSDDLVHRPHAETNGIVYLPKPCGAQELAGALRRCLDP